MRSGLIIFLLLCLLAACERQSPPVLAQVNGRSISRDDFVYAYETSPRSILTGSKQAAYDRVLDRIIQRVLFAQEAERRELQKETETARELASLEDAAIRRELFRESIRKNVKLSDADYRKAFYRDQQTLWVQHAVFDTLEDIIPGAWNPTWVHVSINATTKTVERAGFGMVDLISWNDVDLELEEILYGLALNEVSEPILKKGAIHVFRLVNVETNTMASENQYLLKQEHYRTALRKRQEHALAFNFVREVMAPESLIIRRHTIEQLTRVIWQRNPDQNGIVGGSVSELNSPALDLDDLNKLELATFKSGRLLVEDFRFYYKMNPYKLSRVSLDDLQKDLINAIGIYVRDIVFAKKGRTAGYAGIPAVRQDVQYWQERLLASKLEASIYEHISASGSVNPAETGRIVEQELDKLFKNLKQETAISIDQEMLMTIRTSDEGLARKIDFFAGYLN